MYTSKGDFINEMKSIFSLPYYKTIPEESIKFTEHSINSNRCVVMIYKYADPSKIYDKIPTYRYIQMNEIIDKMYETSYFKPEIFGKFINDTLSEHTCKMLVLGTDIKSGALKVYLSIKNDFKDISYGKCMEINRNNDKKYKLYDSIDCRDHFYYINSFIFPEKIKNTINKHLQSYYEWGYYRNELKGNHKNIYGLDILINRPISHVEETLVNLLYDLNITKTQPQFENLVYFIENNLEKNLYWIGINYKNNITEISLYYRNIENLIRHE